MCGHMQPNSQLGHLFSLALARNGISMVGVRLKTQGISQSTVRHWRVGTGDIEVGVSPLTLLACIDIL